MSYTVTAITALTPTHISVLLSDDVAYDVDRGAFEEWVTDGKGRVQTALIYINPDTNNVDISTDCVPLDKYWQDHLGASVHVEHVNGYLAHSKSEQLEIDVVRTKSNLSDTLDTLLERIVNKAYNTRHEVAQDIDYVSELSAAYGTAQFNLGQYKNL